MVMVACLLLLFLLTLNQAFAQPGFLSIQSCTSSEPTDPLTKIKYTSDNYLLEGVGICKNVSGSFVNNFFSQTARIFGNDDHDQWCYNLPVVEGQGYLLRATFEYGPLLRSITGTTFTLSIGTTSISQINSSVDFMMVEGVFAATKNHTSMCLRKGIGNAYISKIEMRPLDHPNYVQENSSIVLKLMHRVDLGNNVSVYRYPEDSADRIWNVDVNSRETDTLSSSTISLRGANSSIPIEVLETAAQNAEHLQFLHTDLDTSCDDYLIILYFLELDVNVKTGQRVFDVYVNGGKMYEKFDILQNGSSINYREVPMRVKSNGYLNISLVQSSNGEKYGPICNAYEIFQVHQKSVETVQRDWNAMLKLKEKLLAEDPANEMMKTWYGDPCVPSPWEGLACEKRDNTLVITKLDLSAMKLEGPLPTFITNLAELRELNIPNDGFAGSIPESLTSHKRVLLSKLPIICKNISSKLPSRLSDRENLTVNCIVPSPSQTQKPQLNCSGACVDGGASEAQSPSRNIYVIGTVAGGSVAVSVAVGIFFTCFYRCGRPKKKEYPIMKNVVFSDSSIREPSMAPTVQSFSLQYIQKATSNYSTLIGEGGFGAVYRGTLPHGEEVAVKVWSATSTQGTREFDNEVSLLSTIRHENLVPLLGYCCENDQQILVYPFMSNGSLQDRLYGEASKRKVLDWPTRLSIALGAARGLLYLHSFGRCIIHRDVKSSNILLDHTMCGKVADFGFSKYAPQEGDSAASLEVRGTAGYLDPEYYSTQQLSTKSDVFSFGVVLLEVVTGREPLNVQRPRNEWSLVEWAKPFIRESRIDEIVDPNIKTGYHAEAMWRVVEAALACIEPFSTYRPSMVDIVRELEDALIIENNASEYMRSIESFGGSNRFGSNRFGSNRFISLERKVLSSTSSPPQPTPPNYSQVPAPLPR